MLRCLLFLFASWVALSPTAAAAERRLAYRSGEDIYVAGLDGSNPKKIATGSDPEISPDGTRVAYTQTDAGGDREIAIVEVATGEKTSFKRFHINKAYGPNWLPDGSALTFHFEEGSLWHLGWIKADGSGFRILRRSPNADGALQGVAWLSDGQSFFAYDLTSIYRFDAQGALAQTWRLATLIPKASFSAGGAISVSADGRKLLVEVDMIEANPNKEDANPPSAIWSVDPAAGKATRVTPKGVAYHSSPRWLSADEIIFRSSGGKNSQEGIVRARLGRPERTLIVPKATYPSLSRP